MLTRAVCQYFDMFQIVQGTYKELFLPELDAFFDLCDAGRRGEVRRTSFNRVATSADQSEQVDPLWLSVLFIVLAISASDILSTIIHDEPATAKSAIPNPHHCYAAARKCLHLGDWSGSPPKARVIQTTIVMAQVSSKAIHLVDAPLTSLCLFAVGASLLARWRSDSVNDVDSRSDSCGSGAEPRQPACIMRLLTIALQALGLHQLGGNPET